MVTIGLHEGGRIMTPTVLFIHGFLDDVTVWDGVIAALPDKVDVIQYDLPGSGTRSQAVADPDSITLESLAVVVGHSMGSQVAELVAAGHADRVQGLVLVTPVPLGGTQLTTEELAPFRALGGDT